MFDEEMFVASLQLRPRRASGSAFIHSSIGVPMQACIQALIRPTSSLKGQGLRHEAMLKAFAIADNLVRDDLSVLLACQVEAALLLGQLGNLPQHAFPLFGFCPLPRGHGFCHSLQDMQFCRLFMVL